MTEKQLEQKLKAEVSTHGGIAYKFVSPGHVGVPDRVVLLPGGRVVFVEVKAPGAGRLSKMQAREIRRIRELGVECYVLDKPELIERIIT